LSSIKNPELDEGVLSIMGALVRMPPKPHEEMKLGKPRRVKPKPTKRIKKNTGGHGAR
jgi:hypothetical protein